jgi:FkbM family methyltransferase
MRLHRSDLEDDIAEYIQQRMPAYAMDVLVDCGANVGWFTYQFLRAFASLRAYCFEPIPSVAEALTENLRRFPELHADTRVSLQQVALSDRSGAVTMTNEPGVTVNRVVDVPTTEGIRVPATTGDEFCSQHRIERISFLKIDCEGKDHAVLNGFSQMIAAGRVDFVQVEAAIGEAQGVQRPLASFEQVLLARGYRHFRFINQASDGPAFLSRADVVFIRHALATDYGIRYA